MLIVRAAKQNDLKAIYQLAKSAAGKLHSLPVNKKLLTKKLALSERSFDKKLKAEESAFYFFVLEDLTKNKLVGCSAINADAGKKQPYYLYRLIEQEQYSQDLKHRKKHKLLELSTDLNHAAELCALYLLPEYREKKIGKLLSYARLLYIASFNGQFPERIFADIRGFCNKKGISPFWQQVTKYFLPLSFAKADELMGQGDNQFIYDLMPKSPVYIDLLPTAAQKVIGKAHHSSHSAQKLLEQERFHHHDYVNILDAGPTMLAFKQDIKTITDSHYFSVQLTEKLSKKSGKIQDYLLVNNQYTFKVVFCQLIVEGKEVLITPDIAQALGVSLGDKVLAKCL